MENYGKRCFPGAYRFKTERELNELLTKKSLTKRDLESIYRLRWSYYGMQSDRGDINTIGSTHHNEPSTIIFLDIKGTLYEGGTHGTGKGLLARSRLDSRPITYDEIDAFGNLIVRTMPQDLSQVSISNTGYEIVPTELADQFLVERPKTTMDTIGHLHRPYFMTKTGPFTVVFISSDPVETQKNIVAFLYYIAKFIDNVSKNSTAIYDKKIRIDAALKKYYEGYIERMKERFGNDVKLIEEWENLEEIRELLHSLSSDVSVEGTIERIEEALLYYDNDFMKFLEYENKNYANLSSFEMEKFRQIINGLYFLSTSETGKTKGQLMEEFLESDTRKKRAGYKYQVFALGDDYSQDGEMLRKAYQYGGIGLIRAGDNHSTYCGSIGLTIDLAKIGINIPFIPIVNSIAEFYNGIMKHLAMIRENEIIEAMQWANRGVESNHVLESSNVPYHLIKV